MRRIKFLGSNLFLILFCQTVVFCQGEVGIGTTTPQEKLDVNGAVIIRSESTAGITAPGTIQFNTTNGWHEGWLSSSEWRKQENDYDYLSGNYSVNGCGAALSANIGSYVISSSGAESPFYRTTADKKIQYLIRASELTAAGFCAGDLTSIGFVIITLGTTNYSEYSIALKNTSTTSLTAGWEAGATSVFGPSTITAVVGNNDFSITPFYWDGVNNLLVEVCYNNTTTGTNSTVQVDNSGGYNKLTYKTGTSLTPCSSLILPTNSVNRPVIRLSGKTTGAYLVPGNYYQFNKGLVLGSPLIPVPYEHHGQGTITGEAIYDDNTLLSDYVFDYYFDGKISNEDLNLHADYELLPLEEMIRFMIDKRHLPTINGKSDWEQNGKFSVGALSTQLWKTAETHALYLIELNNRVEVLQQQIDQLKK